MTMFYQTVHQKHIFDGYISRTPPNVRSLLDNRSFPVLFMSNHPEIIKDLSQEEYEKIISLGPKELENLDIGFIILHKNWLNDNVFNDANLFFSQLLNKTPSIYFYDESEDKEIYVYSIK